MPITIELTIEGYQPGVKFYCTTPCSLVVAGLDPKIFELRMTNLETKLTLKSSSWQNDGQLIMSVADSRIVYLDTPLTSLFVDRCVVSELILTENKGLTISNTRFHSGSYALVYALIRTLIRVRNVTMEQASLVVESLGKSDDSNVQFLLAYSSFVSSQIFLVNVKNVRVSSCSFWGALPTIPQGLSDFYLFGKYELRYNPLVVTSEYRTLLIVEDSVFTQSNVGAIYLYGVGVSLQVINSRFADNEAPVGGAAIFMKGINTAQITNSSFFNNSQTLNQAISGTDACGGGALYALRTLLFTSKCSFESNRAAQFGGAVYGFSILRYESSLDTFLYNEAYAGGAIATVEYSYFTTVQIGQTVMKYNRASYSGGAMFFFKADISFGGLDDIASTIEQNVARIMGGGLYLVGSKRPKMGRTVISNNVAEVNSNLGDATSFPETVEITPKSTNRTMLGSPLGYNVKLKDLFGNRVPLNNVTLVGIVGDDFKAIYLEVSNVEDSGRSSQLLLTPYALSENWRYYNQPITSSISISYQGITFMNTFEVGMNIEACNGLTTVQLSRSLNRLNLYECRPNIYYILGISASIVFVFLLIIIGFTIFAIIKIRGMSKKVKRLDVKEKAEIELTQKLLDLQSLYSSHELESKHSYKNWLIKIEDLELIRKVGEGGNGVVYQAK